MASYLARPASTPSAPPLWASVLLALVVGGAAPLPLHGQSEQAPLYLTGGTVVNVTEGTLQTDVTIVVDRNPLEDITNVQDILVVVSNGQLAVDRLPFAATE